MYNRGISTIVVVIDEQIIEGIVIDNLFLKIKEVFDFLNISKITKGVSTISPIAIEIPEIVFMQSGIFKIAIDPSVQSKVVRISIIIILQKEKD